MDPSFRIAGGTKALIDTLAQTLTAEGIVLNATVRSIDFSVKKIQLKTDCTFCLIPLGGRLKSLVTKLCNFFGESLSNRQNTGMKAVQISDFSMSKLPEDEVINRILSGEKELYEILMRRNNQKLFRIIRGYLHDTEEIQDIMQDTYITAYEKLWQYKHNAQFSTWLIRIGINQALARISQRTKVRSINPIAITTEIEQEIKDENQPGPEKNMMRNEAKELLEKAIDNLDEKYRSIYIMKEVEEMSISDISDCTDLSTSNVKVRLHRAKGMIKENLYALSYSNELFEFGFSKCDRLVENVMERI